MRVSSFPPSPPHGASPAAIPGSVPQQAAQEPLFQPFGAQAFERAHRRGVPVFLIIGEIPDAFDDPSLSMQLRERTVPVHLLPGMRPDVELLCQRAGVLFSQEGALPLCALLLSDSRPFLAAPLPPQGFALDPARLFAWLSHADRRFVQNQSAMHAQASQVMKSFRAEPLRRPYSPQDAAHDLLRALLALEDRQSGGFGQIKAPFVTGLRFLQHTGRDSGAHAALSRALSAMLCGALYDPLDGGFFRSTLTDDWRVFVPQKMTAMNAMLALILLESGRRAEAVRTLDFILNTCSLPGGALAPYVAAPQETYAFTPEQVCAHLGSEDGLRACRLLSLLRQHAGDQPLVTPSRFSPVSHQAQGRRLSMDGEPLCPRLSAALTPEDAAFLSRVRPKLLRARQARTPQRPAGYLLTQDCALTAAVLALVGQRLGETRYTQAAQRAVSHLMGLSPVQGAAAGLPPAFMPAGAFQRHADCGACAALSLAQLTLAKGEGMEQYAAGGLRLLSASLHAFVRNDGLVMSTPEDRAAFFPRMPAIYDSELPSAAALLAHSLRIAHELHPQARFDEAIEAIWQAAAPSARMQPLAMASLIDAMTCV